MLLTQLGSPPRDTASRFPVPLPVGAQPELGQAAQPSYYPVTGCHGASSTWQVDRRRGILCRGEVLACSGWCLVVSQKQTGPPFASGPRARSGKAGPRPSGTAPARSAPHCAPGGWVIRAPWPAKAKRPAGLGVPPPGAGTGMDFASEWPGPLACQMRFGHQESHYQALCVPTRRTMLAHSYAVPHPLPRCCEPA